MRLKVTDFISQFKDIITDYISEFEDMGSTFIVFVAVVIRSTLFFLMYLGMAGEYLILMPIVLIIVLIRLAAFGLISSFVLSYSKEWNYTPYVLPFSFLPTFFINFLLIALIQRMFGLCSAGIPMAMFLDLVILTPVAFVITLLLAVASRKQT